MADPIAWQALEALKTIYSGVTKANNFHTDIGKNVSLENRTQSEENTPDLIITGTPAEEGIEGDYFRSWKMAVAIEARIPIALQDAQKLAWQIHDDLMRAAPRRKADIPLAAHAPKVTGVGEIFQAEPGQPFIVVQIILTLSIINKYSNT